MQMIWFEVKQVKAFTNDSSYSFFRSTSRLQMVFANLQDFHDYQISCVNAHANDLRINLFLANLINEAKC